MRKTRRIEVTAFRRQIVIHRADGPATAGASPSVSGDDGTFELTRIDSDEGPASDHDATRAAELTLLVETLIGSEGRCEQSFAISRALGRGGGVTHLPDQNQTGDETTCEKSVAGNKQISGGQR